MNAVRACCFTLACLLYALALPAGAAVVNATWNSATDVPFTASSYTATGNTVNFTLNYAPATGTNLMVVNNTGLPFISGTFDNLAQGQAVSFSYNGVAYTFVASYYDGMGNDLVLVWAGRRPVAWGNNGEGQLGNNSYLDSPAPAAVTTAGTPLANGTILTLASGGSHSLALCSDGSIACWGYNAFWQLGNSVAGDYVTIPIAVTTMGTPLAGKVVAAVSAGHLHSLALCTDGTVASWGFNSNGQLGNSSTTSNKLPVAVTAAGTSLSGKQVVAISAGNYHSLALCSDGTVSVWGIGSAGQLGNSSKSDSSVPVAVTTEGTPLQGKSVVAIAAGFFHTLALCSDGTLVAWGGNGNGQLGNNSTTDSSVPVAVVTAGTVLEGKTVVAVAAGEFHNMALCSDGTIASWGYNGDGELGNNSTAQCNVPVPVTTAGTALAGKTVIRIAAGHTHSMAICSDGSIATWGNNGHGQLGNNSTTQSSTPVAVGSGTLGAGERMILAAGGGDHNLALAAMTVPAATTLSATSVTSTSAVLNGTVNANGSSAVASFDYGLDTTYGTNVTGSPVTVSGSADTAVSMSLTGLMPATTYHFRAHAINSGELADGGDQTFTTSSTYLSSLGPAALSPAFTPQVTSYTLAVGSEVSSISFTPTVQDSNAKVTVNGMSVGSGSTSSPIPLGYGDNTISLIVTAADHVSTLAYSVVVTRAVPSPLPASFASGSDVAVNINGFTATGSSVNFSLNYAPVIGTTLIVVNNTGLGFIHGTFNNLSHGQTVSLRYNGVNYAFVASYNGGTGNDLVLMWAGRRPVAWGANVSGALGNNSGTDSYLPTSVTTAAGALANRTILAFSSGSIYSLAVCNDGSVVSWGNNSWGQLGNNTIIFTATPTFVTTSGTPLAGKVAIAVSAGHFHGLALCSDGTVAGWGYNYAGQLGNNSTSDSNMAVAVTASGTSLAGKSVVAIGAGGYHSLALCSDGTISSWGDNTYGQLGNNNTIGSSVPVMVNSAGTPLQGRTVTAIAVGGSHNLALCADGTLVAWGANSSGQLGNNATTNSNVPVAVITAGTPLQGRTVVAIAAGSSHNLVLCSDGTLITWGYNFYGQLGNGSTTNNSLPVAVTTVGTVLAGKTVTEITAGALQNVVMCSDGTPAAWGYNFNGQLGSNSTTDSSVPVAVNTSTLAAGEHFLLATCGANADHCLALVATPSPAVTTLAATSVDSNSAILNGTVNANGNTGTVSFDYGLDANYGTNVTASPATVSGSADTAASVALTGLAPSTTYHFRVNASNYGELANGGDQTFTTANLSLSSLVLGSVSLSPAFSSAAYSYTASVGSDVSSLTVSPMTSVVGATLTVNGISVATDSASSAVPLVYGNTVIKIVITAADKVSTLTYSVVVTRAIPNPLPASFASGNDVAVSINGFTASGGIVTFALNYAPVTGTMLTVINNTGSNFINGTFSNLAQGQSVALSYNGINYNFTANYFGGTGNDLVLHWAGSRAFSWGTNSSGQLGDVTTIQRGLPVPVNILPYYDQFFFTTYPGILSGKTLISMAAGGGHSLALCSDGALAAWGDNTYGQLGGSTPHMQKGVPVAVNASSLSSLYGKGVVAIAAGASHSMALCSDGTVSAWGFGGYGQLGNNSSSSSPVAAAVVTSYTVSGRPTHTALFGRTVVAIAAGQNHCLALCSDGIVAAWGDDSYGQLGTNSTTSRLIAVAVNTTSGISALFGKTVVAIAAGGNHSFALCSDGTLVAWGANGNGQLGDGTTIQRNAPVAVNVAAGTSALYGKTVTAVAGGLSQSLALCSDGTLAAWGGNASGQVGDATMIDKYAPVAVSTAAGSSALAGKTVTGITASAGSSFALCSDGTVASWGADASGQLGDNATNNESSPVAVNSSPLALGAVFSGVFGGSSASHTLALVASPPTPVVTTLAATVIAGTSVTLNGTVNASNNSSMVTFDYGTTTAYGTTVSAAPATVTGGSSTAVGVALTGLAAGTTYHFRVNGLNAVGTSNGADLTFTTLPSVLQSWRQQFFGTTANAGPTADAADYDNDGIPNLIEWACNLSPTARSALPAAVVTNGANFEYTYSRSTAAVTAGGGFAVEWSDTLASGSWSSSGVVQTVLSDDGTTQQVKAVIPINAANAKFVHLSVSAPP